MPLAATSSPNARRSSWLTKAIAGSSPVSALTARPSTRGLPPGGTRSAFVSTTRSRGTEEFERREVGRSRPAPARRRRPPRRHAGALSRICAAISSPAGGSPALRARRRRSAGRSRGRSGTSAVSTSRVVPATGDVTARSRPASALSSVLLPALGRPTSTTCGSWRQPLEPRAVVEQVARASPSARATRSATSSARQERHVLVGEVDPDLDQRQRLGDAGPSPAGAAGPARRRAVAGRRAAPARCWRRWSRRRPRPR